MHKTEKLFLDQSYDTEFGAVVVDITDEGGIILDRTLFYATSGGQPGDCGTLTGPDGKRITITTAQKGDGFEEIVHIPEASNHGLKTGDNVNGTINWDRRHKHMRMHSCMHLLCSLVDGAVTGGSLTHEKARLDFAVNSDALDKEELTEKLNALINNNHDVHTYWITDDELAAQPDLIRTMSVSPPSGSGKVRLLQVGENDNQIDLQPCGGTHVKNTSEIGRVHVRKIENKGKMNKRVTIVFDEEDVA